MQLIYSHQDIKDIRNRNIVTHTQGSIELLKITKGKMECLVNGDEFLLEEGDICIINKGAYHRIYCVDDKDAECEFLCLYLEPDMFTSHEETFKRFIKPIFESDSFIQIISKSKDAFNKDLSALLTNIDELESKKPSCYELLLIGYLHMLMQKIYLRCIEDERKTNDSSSYDLFSYSKMSEYISSNYNNKITLNDLSSIAHISKNKVCSLFKKYALSSPIDYINGYRLEIACRLLEESDLPISEISYRCGFNEPSYFNRVFLKTYEMTPKEYRKTIK